MEFFKVDIADLNARAAGDAAELVRQADEHYRLQVRQVAEQILENRETRPIVLLSGPSGSGKTTTALLIEKYLDEAGCETHTLSMDNYFLTLTDEMKRQAACGQLDFESPERVDVPYLNRQLRAIELGQPVEIPRFDFKEARRVPSGRVLTRGRGDLVILEGIHAMNPDVITLSDDETLRLYISVRTGVVLGDTELPPAGVRLLRRMIRDSRFRKRSFVDTLGMYDGVERGEKAYIAPYMERATHAINTFHPYELGLYKTLLAAFDEKLPLTAATAPLLAALEAATPVPADLPAPDALIREFAGDSALSY